MSFAPSEHAHRPLQPACQRGHRPARADRPGLHLLAVGPDQDRGTGAGSAGPAGAMGLAARERIRAGTVPQRVCAAVATAGLGGMDGGHRGACAAADADPRAGYAGSGAGHPWHDPGDPGLRVSPGVPDARAVGGVRAGLCWSMAGPAGAGSPAGPAGSRARAHDGRRRPPPGCPPPDAAFLDAEAPFDAPDDWGAWMARAQAGDQQDYRRLLQAIGPLPARDRAAHVRGRKRPRTRCRRSLLVVHGVRHTYEPGRPFRPWLSTIATRRCIDILRRRQREGLRVGDALALEAQADEAPDPLARLEQAQRRRAPACGGGRAQPRAARCGPPAALAGVDRCARRRPMGGSARAH